MERKILVIGDSYMNLQMKVESYNKIDGTVEGGDYRFHAFGKSAAAAVTMAKLGGNCVFSTKLGKDTNGDRLMKYYEKCGLSCHLIDQKAGYQTGMSITTYDDLGHHTNYVSRGVCSLIGKAEIDTAIADCPDVFLIPQEPLRIPHEVEEKVESDDDLSDESGEKKTKVIRRTVYENLTEYAVKRAISQEIDMIMEYNDSTAELHLDSIPNLKALIISDSDIYKLTGFYLDSAEKAVRAIVALSAKFKSKFYIINKAGTSFVYDGVNYEFAEAPVSLKNAMEQAEMHTPIFVGAFTYMFVKSRNPARAARYAQIVTLMSRSRYGTLEYIPNKAEIDKYIEDNRIDLNHNCL